MIADAIEKVSENGVITIEESKTMKTEIDVVEGMQFDKGYVSSYMCDDKEKTSIAWTASSFAFFIPFRRIMGFAPAAIFFSPS